MTLRESGEKKSPIVLDMPAGERLRVWREERGGYSFRQITGIRDMFLKSRLN